VGKVLKVVLILKRTKIAVNNVKEVKEKRVVISKTSVRNQYKS